MVESTVRTAAPVHLARGTRRPHLREEHPRAQRHPPRLPRDQVTCGCGNQFTTRSTSPAAARSTSRSARPATRSTPASRRSSTPAVASPASRRATASAPRAAGSSYTDGAHRSGGRRSHVCDRSGHDALRADPRRADDRVARRVARRARRAGARAGRPLGARRRRRRPASWAGATPSSARSSAAARELATARDDEAAARELVAEDPSFADEAREQHARVEELETRLAELLVPARPARRRRRRHGGQVGGGRRGVGAVRRRPGADVPALRRAPRLEGRDARRHRLRPGRLQGRHAARALPRAPTPTACGPR